MTTLHCDQLRDLLPDYASGRLDARAALTVQAHLSGCAECRAELDLVSLLQTRRLAVPAELQKRILARTPVRRTLWGSTQRLTLAASITVALLGASVLTMPWFFQGETKPVAEAPAVTPSQPVGPGWVGVDAAFVSGATLEDLTIEELRALLVELDS